MRNNQRKKTTTNTATITGTITKAPRRIKTQTGRVMAAATLLVESDKRSPYPMQVIGFDLQALELIIHQQRFILDDKGLLDLRISANYQRAAAQYGNIVMCGQPKNEFTRYYEA